MATSRAPDAQIGERFLAALRRRDYDEMGACFAPDATLRSVVPSGWREDDGPDAIVRRFRLWTEEIDGYDVVDSDAAEFADVLRLRWAVRGIDSSVAEPGPSRFEQTAYAEIEDGVITRMRLACSGDRLLAATSARQVP
jgi:ketosteroid isomerase-like protein